MRWREAVLQSLQSYSRRHQTRSISRHQFIAEELATIIRQTDSRGITPNQTLSRTLQELRDQGLIQFLGTGQYLLLDSPFDVESEDLTEEALDYAIQACQLQFGRIETNTTISIHRRRQGQERLRKLCLVDYAECCAVCDVREKPLLVASHILRWADAPEQRGDLTNILYLCRFHDVLFEQGWWTLSDQFEILKPKNSESQILKSLLDTMQYFRMPCRYCPNPEYLVGHRRRIGLSR